MDLRICIVIVILCAVVYPLIRKKKNPRITDDKNSILGIILVLIAVLGCFSLMLFFL
jgi:hypothetical protein